MPTEEEQELLDALVKEIHQPEVPPPEPQATNESIDALLAHNNNPVYPE